MLYQTFQAILIHAKSQELLLYFACAISLIYLTRPLGFPGGIVVKNLPANARDMDSIPGLGISLGEENGNRLQYSHLGNPTDRVWWAVVHGLIKGLDTAEQLNNSLDCLRHLILFDLDNHGIPPHLSKIQRLFSKYNI